MTLASGAGSVAVVRRRIVGPAVGAVVALVAFAVWRPAEVADLVDLVEFTRLLRTSWHTFGKDFPFLAPTYLALAAILVLQRRFPAWESQPLLSRGLSVDLVWMLLAMPVVTFGADWYVRGLGWILTVPLADMRLNLNAHLPFAALVVVSFVIGDFLAWVRHYLKHKVGLLWRFHLVHHAAQEMNPFTDARVHLVEYFVNWTTTSIPLIVLGADARETLPAMLVAQLWYARFYHSNVRMNLGPLRHVLVTPQYHRVHHSVENQDVDRNFGNFLTVWDRLFGTISVDYERYPDTGVIDPAFPHPKSRAPGAAVATYWAQFTYPFQHRAAPVSRQAPSAPAIR